MPIPTPFTVGHRVYTEAGGFDEHGNPVATYSDPVAVPVFGVSPRLQEEPDDPRRAMVVEGLSVYAPAHVTGVREHDRIVWPFVVDVDGVVLLSGDEFEVDGPVADWTKGPWPNPVAGHVIHLSDVRG